MSLDQRVMYLIVRYQLYMEDFILGSHRSGPFLLDQGDGTHLVQWWVNCSDTFGWAISDADLIHDKTIDLFEAVCKWAAVKGHAESAPLLFCCKLRGMLPKQVVKIERNEGKEFMPLAQELLDADLDMPGAVV